MPVALQTLMVVPTVLACGVYSAWSLMPTALRRKLALVLVRQRWARGVPAIGRAARAPVGCGCDGCDRAAPAAGPGAERAGHAQSADPGARARVIRIVAQRPRR